MKIVIPLLLVSSLFAPAKEGRSKLKPAAQAELVNHIAELRAAQKSIPDAKDTLLALEAASGNHLRAFHRNLRARDGKYKATHLPKSDLKAILAGEGPAGAAGCGGCGGCKKADNSKGDSKEMGKRQGRGRGQSRRRGRGRRRGQEPN